MFMLFIWPLKFAGLIRPLYLLGSVNNEFNGSWKKESLIIYTNKTIEIQLTTEELDLAL